VSGRQWMKLLLVLVSLKGTVSRDFEIFIVMKTKSELFYEALKISDPGSENKI
jgi:hypothetical protein